MKCWSRVPGHGAWLLSVSRTINIQGIILPDITAAEKCTLFLDSNFFFYKVSGASNVGQRYQVKVRGCEVCKGQLQCNVSYSQLSMLQRNVLNF